MNITIKPSKLSGSVVAVPSTHEAHIKLICAAFSIGTVRNVPFTEDVCATLDALKELGFTFDVIGDCVKFRTYHPNNRPSFNCGESLETMSYFMCMACACAADVEATFDGSDKIPVNIIEAILNVLNSRGVTSDFNGSFPFTIKGKLQSGEWSIPDDYAEYIVSCLLIALSLNNTDSFINVTGSDYSRSKIYLCADILKEAEVLTASANDVYIIRGGQSFRLIDTAVGGDFVLASNFVVANAMNSNVRVLGLDAMSPQPEKVLFDIMRKIRSEGCKGFDLDCSDVPELVPILAVYACTLSGSSCLRNINAYSHAEYVDAELVCNMINTMGGKVTALSDRIVIDGVKNMTGGTIDCKFDHRFVYAGAILSTVCTGEVTVMNAECVAKRYPTFFDDFRRVGGNAVTSVD